MVRKEEEEKTEEEQEKGQGDEMPAKPTIFTV